MAERKSNNKNNKKKRFNGNSDEEFNPKFRKTRKKVCTMCANKELVLDYKNYDQMKKVRYYLEEQQVLAQNIKEKLHKL